LDFWDFLVPSGFGEGRIAEAAERGAFGESALPD
jgi:hypothetical protein